MVAMLAGNLLAIAASSLEMFRVVFALQGLQMAALHVSGLNILLEFAPAVAERPTYVGLGNTLTAPVAFAAALGGVAGLAVLLGRVRDPRHGMSAPGA